MSQSDAIDGTAARALATYDSASSAEQTDDQKDNHPFEGVDSLLARAECLLYGNFVQQHLAFIEERVRGVPWYAQPVLEAICAGDMSDDLRATDRTAMARSMTAADSPRAIAAHVGGEITQERVHSLCSDVLGYAQGAAGVYAAAQQYVRHHLGDVAIHLLTGTHMDLPLQAPCPFPTTHPHPSAQRVAHNEPAIVHDGQTYRRPATDPTHSEYYTPPDPESPAVTQRPRSDIPSEVIKSNIQEIVRFIGNPKNDVPDWWRTTPPKPPTKAELKRRGRAPGRKRPPRS